MNRQQESKLDYFDAAEFSVFHYLVDIYLTDFKL